MTAGRSRPFSQASTSASTGVVDWRCPTPHRRGRARGGRRAARCRRPARSRSAAAPPRIWARSRIDVMPWWGRPSSVVVTAKPVPSSRTSELEALGRVARHRHRHRPRRGVLDGVLDRLAHDLVQEHLVVGGQLARGVDVELDRDGVAALHLVGERPQGDDEALVAQHPRLEREATARAASGSPSAGARGRSRARAGRSRSSRRRCPRRRRRASSRCRTWSAAARRAGTARACGARPARPRGCGATARPARPRACAPGRAATRPARTAGRSRRRWRRSRPGARAWATSAGPKPASPCSRNSTSSACSSSSTTSGAASAATGRRCRLSASPPAFTGPAAGVRLAAASATSEPALAGSTTMLGDRPERDAAGDGRAQAAAVGRGHEDDGGVGPQQPVGLLGRLRPARGRRRGSTSSRPGCRPPRPGTRPGTSARRAACAATPRRSAAARRRGARRARLAPRRAASRRTACAAAAPTRAIAATPATSSATGSENTLAASGERDRRHGHRRAPRAHPSARSVRAPRTCAPRGRRG